MNFRDLEYVIEVSKSLSFTKAARTCNVSQPSLSAQIKKLEQELGAPIFIRSSRKIHLTAFGEILVQKAQEILSVRDDIRRVAHENQNPLEGKLRLGAILTVAPYIFPQIVHEVQENAPKIKLYLKEGKTEELISLMLAGKLDAAVMSLPTDNHVFETYSLFTEPFYLAVPEHHPLAGKEEIDEHDLDDQTLILLEEGHCFRSQALDICHSSTAKENQMFKATSLETIRHFVSIGEGITLMPEIACDQRGNIKFIPLKNKKFSREIGLVWHKNCHKKLQIEKLASLIADQFSSVGVGG